MAEFKIEGMTALVKRLNSLSYTGSQARNVIQKDGAELQKDAQSRMTKSGAYVKGYSTGNTRRSTTLSIEDSGMTAIVAPNSEYFPYVEYGTRFMEAEPTLGPAFRRIAPMFKKDIEDILNES